MYESLAASLMSTPQRFTISNHGCLEMFHQLLLRQEMLAGVKTEGYDRVTEGGVFLHRVLQISGECNAIPG